VFVGGMPGSLAGRGRGLQVRIGEEAGQPKKVENLISADTV
jgi:hypothetical protein